MSDIWDNLPKSFEVHSKVEEEMKDLGESRIFVFLNDGKPVSKEVIAKALERKGIDHIKPQDSLVFNIEDENGVVWDHWKKVTCYSDLNQLKAIKQANNNTLKGAKVKITRVAVGDKTRSNWKYEEVRERAEA